MPPQQARIAGLPQLFLRAFYWMDEGLQMSLKAKGWKNITRAQAMLFAKFSEGVVRPSDVARQMRISRQAVHQTLNELSSMGLLTLEPDEHDRRAKVIVLTEEGQRIADDACDVTEMLESSLKAYIGEDTVAAMREGLESDWGEPTQPLN